MNKIRKVKSKKSRKIETVVKEQRLQTKEIVTVLNNMGFNKISGIDGNNVIFDGRMSEMDDVFCFENIILLIEYTVKADVGEHLLNKKIFYDKINSDKRAFLDFMITEPKLDSFKKYHTTNLKGKYTQNELQLIILYCSKNDIKSAHKALVKDVIFFDYHIVKYFQSLAKVIKKSSKYEFFHFLNIPFRKVGQNIKNSSLATTSKFFGHILPEEKSSFKEGYKIVSFYIDAESLLKRAYVLRQNGWRDCENIGHYQRMLLSKKIISMRKYLVEKDRVFINNIITSISTDKIKLYDNEGNELKIASNGQFKNASSTEVMPTKIEIEDEPNILGIIDGQHRTFAYHEGDDLYEVKIAQHRRIQNLLVTGVLFPSNESKEKRLKFEANLFLEINSNQSSASSNLRQEIELMVNPFSPTAIAKKILDSLNNNGPLERLLEQYWYEKGKIKTASIVSYGLKPLVKIDDSKNKDSIYSVWSNSEKSKLKIKNNEEYELLNEYVDFAIKNIRELLIAFKINLNKEQWSTPSKNNPSGVLTVTFVNGVLNVLRFMIENDKILTLESCKEKLKEINLFDFKKFKSSQYRVMGEQIFNKYFMQ